MKEGGIGNNKFRENKMQWIEGMRATSFNIHIRNLDRLWKRWSSDSSLPIQCSLCCSLNLKLHPDTLDVAPTGLQCPDTDVKVFLSLALLGIGESLS